MEGADRHHGYLDENLELLMVRFPIVVEKIETVPWPSDRKIVEGRMGFPGYQAEQNARLVNLVSLFDPIREANLQVQGHHIEESEIVLVIGEAGLYHLEAVLQIARKDAKILLISKNPSYLKLVLASRSLEHVFADDRFVVVASEDLNDIGAALWRVFRADIYHVPVFSWFVHPVEVELQEDVVTEIEKMIHENAFGSFFNFNTTAHFEKNWTENYLYNIPHTLTGIPVSELKDSWKGRPAVVVGAGPSLNKNIESLKLLEDRTLILSTDTAYRALQAHGIRPAVMATVDGGPLNFANMRDCSYEDILLAMDVYTHKDIATGSRSGKIVFVSHDMHRAWWEQVGAEVVTPEPFSTGGSVATFAFSLANFLGADPIILVGEDLSYPNGEVYASGTANEKRTLEDVKRGRTLYEVQDADGNTMFTTADYLYYLHWFETQVQECEARCINATEGGALHRGFILQTLAETMEKDCRDDQPVREWIDKIVHREVPETDVRLILSRIRQSKRELGKFRAILKILLHYLNEYVEYVMKEDDAQAIWTVQQIEKGRGLLSRLRLASAFLDGYSFKTIVTDVRLAKQIEKDLDATDEQKMVLGTAKRTMVLFAELADRCTESIVMHEGAYENLAESFHIHK